MLRWDTAASTDIDSNNVKYIHGVSKYARPRKCHTGATPPPSLQLMSPQFGFFRFTEALFRTQKHKTMGKKNDMKSLYSGAVIPFFFFLLQ